MKNIRVLGLIIVLIISGLFVSGVFTSVDTESNTTTPTSTPVISETATPVISYPGEDGRTALELLKENYFDVETKASDFGEYVDSINGIKGGTDGKYWIYYVNNKPATVGADAYETKSTDTIEWRLE